MTIDDLSGDLGRLLLALSLVLLNAFFVIAEFSLVKVGESRLKELAQSGQRRARAALRVLERLEVLLPTVQLGITLSSLTLGWLGVPLVRELLTPFFDHLLAVSAGTRTVLAGALSLGLLAFVHVILGELLPKSLAIRQAEEVVLWSAPALLGLYRLTFPLVWFFHRSVRLVLRLFGLRAATEADLVPSEEELRELVSSSHEQGVLDTVERDLLVNVFDLSDRVAKEVMIPRQDMVCIFTDNTLAEIMDIIQTSGHTRYPLCDGDRDHIVGLVHVRDLVGLVDQQRTGGEGGLDVVPDWRRITHDILMVPEGTSVKRLLSDMQRRRTHMAVVLDEYGGTAGLVTMEDIVEEIVGEIYDEFDQEPPKVQPLGNNAFELDGSLLLEDVGELLGVTLEDPDVDTVGGFVFNRLGRKPKRGDLVLHDRYRFQVLEVKGARIVRLLVEPLVAGTGGRAKATEPSESTQAGKPARAREPAGAAAAAAEVVDTAGPASDRAPAASKAAAAGAGLVMHQATAARAALEGGRTGGGPAHPERPEPRSTLTLSGNEGVSG